MTSENVDMQGINWSSIPTSREKAREIRQIGYVQYRSVEDETIIVDEISPIKQTSATYRFRFTSRESTSIYGHFQLRHLLAATSINDIFYTAPFALAAMHKVLHGVRHWSPITRRYQDVIDFRLSHFQNLRATTLGAKEDLLMVGGWNGDYVLKRLSGDRMLCTGFLSNDANRITNHICIQKSRTGEWEAVVSNNDGFVRHMNLSRLETTLASRLNWPVNPYTLIVLFGVNKCTATSPDLRMICAVGDGADSVIASADSGAVLSRLTGHVDYSYSCAWSPCGLLVATGNQDLTTRIYDVRRADRALCVLGARMAAIRSLQFTEDAKYLVMSESADFVQVVDMESLKPVSSLEPLIAFHNGSSNGDTFSEQATLGADRAYNTSAMRGKLKSFRSASTADSQGGSAQIIEFFGEISGIAVAGRQGDRLFIGNADDLLGGIMEFEMTRPLDRLLGENAGEHARLGRLEFL
eukprot:jgi/Hompol1/4895/HPOL_001038-RA